MSEKIDEKTHYKIQWRTPDGKWIDESISVSNLLEARGWIASHAECCEPTRIVKVTVLREVVT